jgi:5,6-dimethylbenzimidazole synthase
MNADDFYQLVFSRRDVRGEYLADPVAPEVLARILNAAHHAPSVGYSQPWNFILVRDRKLREKVHQDFLACREQESSLFDGARQVLYDRLRLEGILTAPVNLLVTCDRSRGGAVVLGRSQQPDTDIYSTVCAIQNLWLAARAEGMGMGWVSILQTDNLKKLFKLPDPVEPIAYLCLGYVSQFHDKPELEQRGWGKRLPLAELVNLDSWQGALAEDEALVHAIRRLSGDESR